MLDLSHIPSQYPNADVQVFVGSITAQGFTNTWVKPRGKTMGHILLVGHGGNGGAGVIGANSLAGGGGGGGSGGQVSLRFPLWAVPDTLFLTLPAAGSVGINSYVSIAPKTTSNNAFAAALPGGAGGNGTAVPAGGAAGAGAGAISASGMPLGWQWVQQALAGQAGRAGGTTGNGTGVTLPVTGLLVTGGASGAGLSAAAAAGNNGGGLNAAGVFFSISGGGVGNATSPPGSGAAGTQPVPNLLYFYGGTAGGSTHGSATGAGLVQASGGNGAPGCGGGGMGAALTGSTPGTLSLGGPAFCIITCW